MTSSFRKLRISLSSTAALGVSAILFAQESTQDRRKRLTACEEKLKNSAFVFIKPHANTKAAQHLVASTLKSKGIEIKSEGELTAKQIDEGMLIDQHYYAIASKATLLKPAAMPVPKDKFAAEFGVEFDEAIKQGLVFNAIDACAYLGVDALGLDALWGPSKKVKFGGGFYCAEMAPAIPGKAKKIYVFNGFFMSMRSKFVTPGTSIHYYVVDFDPATLSWSDFRGKVLGPTDPKQAPVDSLRGHMLKEWNTLGLEYAPNVGDNCVHASASPFEGLAERMNWLKVAPEKDAFGAKLIAAGVSKATIKEWSVDPQVKGKSLFDSLEDTDAAQCIATAVTLSK